MSTACGRSSADKNSDKTLNATDPLKGTETVIHATDKDFSTLLGSSDKPILVDFWAPWCGPCKMLGPVIEELGKDYAGKALIVKINVDENKLTPSQYNIRGIPAVLVFQNGQLKKNLVGLNSKRAYTAVLDKLIEDE